IIPSWLWRYRALAGSNLAMIGMGVVLMGPNVSLPTLEQAVLGLGAVLAGLVLATMAITWPLSSAFSARLYLRIGFRNSAVIGAVLVVLGALGFLLLPYPGAVWMLVLDQMALGAGFGLISTPLLVGVQSAVDWQRRGVITSANMFSRYLGQSLGAAMYGAIFNAAIAQRLASAPAKLQSGLPDGVSHVMGALQAPHKGG